jgi:hypothetical protein
VLNVLLALLLLPGFQAGTGRIEGSVTIEGTLTPIPDIRVTLKSALTSPEIQTTTDDLGHFSFKDVPQGSYYLSMGRGGGYVRSYKSADTTPVTVLAGQTASPNLTLARTGSIKGRVTRPDGSPVADIVVLAHPSTYTRDQVWLGASTAYGVSEGRTNAQGEYEINSVTPMEYYVLTGDTYSPNAIHPSNALPVIVGSGATAIADIQVQTVARHRVSGQVMPELFAQETSQLYAVYLLYKDTRVRDDVPRDDIASPSRLSSTEFQPETNVETSINGLQFEMRNIRPGAYDVIAVMSSKAQFPYRGIASVDVIDRDVDNVQVTVRPGVTITGNGQFWLSAIGTSPGLGYSPREAEPAPTVAPVRSMQPVFELRGVPPGRYSVNLSNGAVIGDIKQDGKSIGASGLVVGDTAPAPLEISILPSAGSIGGRVQGKDSREAQYAWVSLVPSEPQRDNRYLYRGVRADADGRFSITNVAPGQYKLFTFDEIPYNAGVNATFVSRYESFGVPVAIEEGRQMIINPSVIPLR